MVTDSGINIDLEIVFVLLYIFMCNYSKPMDIIHIDHLDLIDFDIQFIMDPMVEVSEDPFLFWILQ